MRRLGFRNAIFAADESFVNLNDFAFAAHRSQAASAHGLADTMPHEPRGTIGNAKRAMQLMSAEAFLAARHEVKALKPHVQGDMASFHDRPHGDREIFPASLLGAAEQAGAFRLISMVH